WVVLFPIYLAMGIGLGATMAPMTAAVMNSVGPQRAGLGSAMTNTSREVGGVLGIALLGAILTTELKSAFAPAVAGLGLNPQPDGFRTQEPRAGGDRGRDTGETQQHPGIGEVPRADRDDPNPEDSTAMAEGVISRLPRSPMSLAVAARRAGSPSPITFVARA